MPNVRLLTVLGLFAVCSACGDSQTQHQDALLESGASGRSGLRPSEDSQAVAAAAAIDGGTETHPGGAEPKRDLAAANAAGESTGSSSAGRDGDLAVDADAGVDDESVIAPSDAGEAADVSPLTPPSRPVFDLPPATRARLETLITPDTLRLSENAAFIEDGRFFVASDEGIHEIKGGPDSYRAELFFPNPGCTFGGLTSKGDRLYAPCTNAETQRGELVVLEPARAEPLVGRASIPTEGGPLLNGSAFGRDGVLYISNTLAAAPDPAVVRVEISSEEPLELASTALLSAGMTGANGEVGGGDLANGIRFLDDTMYYVRGAELATVEIAPNGTGSTPRVIYTREGGSGFLDDFDIGDGKLWIAESGALGFLGVDNDESSLMVTDLRGEPLFKLPLPFIPSSMVFAIDTMFGPASILITSFYNGGLYRVTFEPSEAP